ncbi:MAG TPA: ABC transporter permease [Acidobacteriota bacterium]|nr:ABC transporter permease [Acidobacteriota bacterium]HNT16928.1 ABC transporter permease [Acidobacteriota bacterium]
MNAGRFIAVARKECLHVWRDLRALGVGIVLPMILLMLFGYALTLDVDDVPLALLDLSGTPESRELTARFDGSPYFSLSTVCRDYGEVEKAIDSRKAVVALIIPADFALNLRSGRTAAVQLIADGSDPNTAQIAVNYAEAIVMGLDREITMKRVLRSGGSAARQPLDLRQRIRFNESMESRMFIVPGLIAVIMMIIAALLTSLTIAREWETGTMEQLISTPVRGTELVLGKLVPYFAIGFVDMGLSVLAGRFLFDVPLRGSVIYLLIFSTVFLCCALGLGILISTLARRQLLASQVAFVVTFLPAFLLSGFMFDTVNMPPVLQAISHIVPAKYFVSLLRNLYLKGAGPSVLAWDALPLLLFTALIFFAAIRAFRKEMPV